ncbi:hypothetical protein BDU57DRAFT_192852 [Ampelomyces quisqualis]|uniref:Secreted protein n=1 Tax=Ampelomyces quisqualis TaxID=50730 RepID=A0A6A5QS98_AMPQU|nr:hypothetical protein BDU57DRAFT_192852 [Ampelomyces quisqualis]
MRGQSLLPSKTSLLYHLLMLFSTAQAFALHITTHYHVPRYHPRSHQFRTRSLPTYHHFTHCYACGAGLGTAPCMHTQAEKREKREGGEGGVYTTYASGW